MCPKLVVIRDGLVRFTACVKAVTTMDVAPGCERVAHHALRPPYIARLVKLLGLMFEGLLAQDLTITRTRETERGRTRKTVLPPPVT